MQGYVVPHGQRWACATDLYCDDRGTALGYRVIVDEVVEHAPHPNHFQRRPVRTIHRTELARFPFDASDAAWWHDDPWGFDEAPNTVRARANAFRDAYRAGGPRWERARNAPTP